MQPHCKRIQVIRERMDESEKHFTRDVHLCLQKEIPDREPDGKCDNHCKIPPDSEENRTDRNI